MASSWELHCNLADACGKFRANLDLPPYCEIENCSSSTKLADGALRCSHVIRTKTGERSRQVCEKGGGVGGVRGHKSVAEGGIYESPCGE